jgi:hypothetical protein
MGRPSVVEEADDAGARRGASTVDLSRGWEHRSTATLGRTRTTTHGLRHGGVNNVAVAVGCATRRGRGEVESNWCFPSRRSLLGDKVAAAYVGRRGDGGCRSATVATSGVGCVW